MTATAEDATSTPPKRARGKAKSKEMTTATSLPAARGDVDDVIARLLNNPSKENVDLIERLLAIRAEKMFNDSLRDCQEEIPRILRDAHNDQTRSKFTRLDTMARVVNPIANKHGFSLSFGTADSKLENHYRITARLAHVAGHHVDFVIDVPAETAGIKGNPNKTAMHAMGSSMTYGRRYLMMMMFNLSLAGEDDDGVAGGFAPLTEEQLAAVKAKIVELGHSDPQKYGERLAKHLGAKALDQIPAHKFEVAMNALLNVQVEKLTRAPEVNQ